MRRLRSGELLAGASAIGLVSVMFMDWFGSADAWNALSFLRFPLLATALLALAIVVLTVSRTVAMACSAAAITVGIGSLTLLVLLFRLAINEPGPDAGSELGAGAYLGLLFVLGAVAGGWRTLADERTGAVLSRDQTERVLAVRGAPRPAPPPRDPSRPERPRGSAT